jgi:chitodextrinase
MRRIHSRFNGARTRVALLVLCSSAVLGLAGASTFGANASATGLVAAYSFDAGSGTTVKDDSGHGNTGTISDATWSSSGYHGKSLSFNGTSSLVRIPDSASLDLTTGMTLEAWIRPSAISGLWRTVIIKEMPGELAYALYAKGDTSAPVGIVNTGAEQFARGTTTLSTRGWQHLAATYDGSVGRLYVNGTQVSSVATSGPALASNGNLDIGGNNVWREWFNGLIDDVRVYNRALSAAELKTDMATAVTAAAPAPPTPTDTAAPTVPSGLRTSGVSTTQVTLSWNASTDNTAVAGYGMYLNGAGSGSASSTSYTFSGLKCGTSYSFGTDAFDAAGNRSASAKLTASTSACPPPPPPPPPTGGDTQAPTTPGALSVTGTTATSLVVSWSASTDNVGVTGYGLYRDGSSVGSTTITSGTVSNLTCGTSYTLAVDATDAAGNRSAKRSTTASTAACSTGGGGGGAASVFVSPNGSDSNPCTQSQPCQSFDRAETVAAPGATVQVAAGTYGSQTINQAPKAAPDVVFQPASGATVTLRDLEVTQGAHIVFQDFNVTGDTYNRQGAQYITYLRIKMGLLYVRGADHISYIDGEVGPNDSNDYMNWITEPYQSSDPAQDILVDGMKFHDFLKHNAGSHVDCLGIGNSDRITIRNSQFWNCEHFAIIPGIDPSGGAARNLVIENNFIQCCESGYYSIGLGDASGVTIRFNSIAGAGIGWLGGTVNNVVIDSNIIDTNNSANCANANWSYNVVGTGSACGGTTAADGFMLPPTDLHLRLGAAAIGAGNPTNHPTTDIDGQARPSGVKPDAGADQK